MATIIRSDVPNTYSIAYDELWKTGFAEQPTLMDSLFEVKDIDTKQWDAFTTVGLGLWSTTVELGAINQDGPYAGYTKTFTPVKYTNGINISWEAVNDDYWGEMERGGDKILSMARGASTIVEKKAAAIINGGFATETTPDGQYLFSNNHPLKEKGIKSSTAGDNLYTGVLNHDNLETFETQIDNNLVDDRGLPIASPRPSILLVPPALKATAERIVSSRAVSRPSVADNDINVYSSAYQVVVWPYLSAAFGGSDTAWFLVAPKQGLRFFWRERPGYYDWVNNLNQSYWFGGSMRFIAGAIDWRGIWGSDGSV